MLRGFATARIGPMDSSSGLGVSHAHSRRSAAQHSLDAAATQIANQTTTASSLGRAILFFGLVLLVLGVLPATFVLWGCIAVVVLTFLRLRVQAQHLHDSLEQEASERRDYRALGLGGPMVRVIPGGGLLLLQTEPHTALERINLQLRQLDEEMGFAGYDLPYSRGPFSATSDVHGSLGFRSPPVSDVDIATLPCYTYKVPCGARAAEATPTPVPPTDDASTAPVGGPSDSIEGSIGRGPKMPMSKHVSFVPMGHNSGSNEAAQQRAKLSNGCGVLLEEAVASTAAAVDARNMPGEGPESAPGLQGLTCPVCLDTIMEGSTVMALPCLHQFHAPCVTPWLRQQGMYATCPMCKTPVFQ